jgi:hypothetical protein
LQDESDLNSQRPARIPRPSGTLDRNRRINEAEAQIAAGTSSLLDEEKESNLQTERIISTMGEKRQMALPGTRDAPKFSNARPRELRRFIRQMEDAWKEAGVEGDADRKESLGKYADQESEEEWSALETYGAGHSWDSFKKEILENYPEASAAERGTPARLRQIVRDAGSIDLGETTELYAYRRAFLAEANKLCKEPRVMSNRELVELFMAGLSTAMGQTILQYLGSTGKKSTRDEKGKEGEGKGTRRPEDKYDLEEVCLAATEVSENAQGMLSYKMGATSSGSKKGSSTLVQTALLDSKVVTEKLDNLEATQAAEKDRLDVVNKQWGAKLDAIEGLMKTLLTQTHEKPSSSFVQNVGTGNRPGGFIDVPGRVTKNFSTSADYNCFGCGESGHFQNNCERVKTLLKNGTIIHSREGRVRLPDGSRVPNIPAGASLIKRVEKHYASMKPAQSYFGAYEEMEDKLYGSAAQESVNGGREVDEREQRLAKLEKEFELKEREGALFAKQLKLEAKGSEKADMRSFLLEHFDEELAALQSSEKGFH